MRPAPSGARNPHAWAAPANAAQLRGIIRLESCAATLCAARARLGTDSAAATFVGESLQWVGLDPSFAPRNPHRFSGGQRARIGIARVLTVLADLLVCHEAVAALDVSIRAPALNLFMGRRDRSELTSLLITQGLGKVGTCLTA